ncbi:hypothetical protein PAPYR_3565 [Paratrimastix pyriformis]|uniref:THH1/TOM1/TOM3 domain-containing protein n=1 Tax=Paratrimastix pyriformis TaxID=342808 RepID=A0ABQ8UP11_9EUKA|nr:hypothetical protein PAPYR_3565 [Paratrimastix pyriformis]
MPTYVQMVAILCYIIPFLLTCGSLGWRFTHRQLRWASQTYLVSWMLLVLILRLMHFSLAASGIPSESWLYFVPSFAGAFFLVGYAMLINIWARFYFYFTRTTGKHPERNALITHWILIGFSCVILLYVIVSELVVYISRAVFDLDALDMVVVSIFCIGIGSFHSIFLILLLRQRAKVRAHLLSLSAPSRPFSFASSAPRSTNSSPEIVVVEQSSTLHDGLLDAMAQARDASVTEAKAKASTLSVSVKVLMLSSLCPVAFILRGTLLLVRLAARTNVIEIIYLILCEMLPCVLMVLVFGQSSLGASQPAKAKRPAPPSPAGVFEDSGANPAAEDDLSDPFERYALKPPGASGGGIPAAKAALEEL